MFIAPDTQKTRFVGFADILGFIYIDGNLSYFPKGGYTPKLENEVNWPILSKHVTKDEYVDIEYNFWYFHCEQERLYQNPIDKEFFEKVIADTVSNK